MKKKLILLSLLGAAVFTNAQVGVNTGTPAATLDVVAGTDNTTADVEGVLVPRVSMNKAMLMAGSTPDESTLIYVDDISDYTAPAAGVDFEVEEITANGFYHWDGTKWVQFIDTNTQKDGLWAQRDNNGKLETYLIPALNQDDIISYKEDKTFNVNLGQVTKADKNRFPAVGQSFGFDPDNSSPISLVTSSDALANTSVTGPGENTINPGYEFTNMLYIIRENHSSDASSGKVKRYLGTENNIAAVGVTSPISSLTAHNSSSDYFSDANLSLLQGAISVTSGGSVDGTYTPTINTNRAHYFYTRNYGTSNNITGIEISNRNYSESSNIRGIKVVNPSHEIESTVNVPAHTLNTLWGTEINNIASKNGTITNMRGLKSFNIIDENATVTDGRGLENTIDFKSNSNTTYYAGIQSDIFGKDDASVTELYGARINHSLEPNFTVDNFYGLRIADIARGSNSNFSIFTGTGDVSFGDDVTIRKSGDNVTLLRFQSERPWEFRSVRQDPANGATADLVLQSMVGIKNFVIADLNMNKIASFYVHGTADLNQVNLAEDGGIVNIGTVSSPFEKLNVDGKVKAEAFIATTNGSVFPDYVFEEYFEGDSETKLDYDFKSLDEVETFVKENGHLPGYTSATAIAEAGHFDMTATQLTNVEKIEELYLHTIEQEAKIQKQSNEIEELKAIVQQLVDNQK